VPARKHRRLEAIRKLRVSTESVEGILGFDANDRNLQLIAEILDNVQEPFLTKRVPCQYMVDFIDDRTRTPSFGSTRDRRAIITYGSSRSFRGIDRRSRRAAINQDGAGTGGACTMRTGVVVASAPGWFSGVFAR